VVWVITTVLTFAGLTEPDRAEILYFITWPLLTKSSTAFPVAFVCTGGNTPAPFKFAENLFWAYDNVGILVTEVAVISARDIILAKIKVLGIFISIYTGWYVISI
jgi:hypothetical protein